MFYANMAIDSIQDAKINFLKQNVKEDSLKKPLVDFVEAQRVFTKQVAKSTNDVMNIAAETFANSISGITNKKGDTK
tara:strand:+ start:1008 stop:1238 length:231 start_codon:yes stop_codon:yes gene_type:complete